MKNYKISINITNKLSQQCFSAFKNVYFGVFLGDFSYLNVAFEITKQIKVKLNNTK